MKNGLVNVKAHTREGYKVSSYERAWPGQGKDEIRISDPDQKISRIDLSGAVGGNSCAVPSDAASIKLSLERLGHYKYPSYVTDKVAADWMDSGVTDGIKKFQSENNLPVTGRITPGDDTHQMMETALNNNKTVVGKAKEAYQAAMDMEREYLKMREAWTPKSDDYFHCKANFNATMRGTTGEKLARRLGDFKEGFDYFKNMYRGLSADEALADYKNDVDINSIGRERAKSGKYNSALDACKEYIPTKLNKKYW